MSSGGVGSSALFNEMKQVAQKINSAADRDSLKHRLFHITANRLVGMVVQNRTLSCGTRLFVYTFADAAASVFSLYRRNYQRAHNTKLHVKGFPARCFPSNTSVYANDGIDYLGLESHFYSYLHAGLCSEKVPVVFLRSEGRQIPAVWDYLAAALIDPLRSFNQSVIDLKINESHYARDEKTAGQFAKMQEIYAKLQEQLDSLGYMSIAFKNKLLRLV